MSIASHQSSLLLIEDSDEDFTAFVRFSRQFMSQHPIIRCRNGEEAIQFLEEANCNDCSSAGNFPALIVLDLNLPGTDGREILTLITNHSQWKQIPTIIFTSSTTLKDIQFCYRQGARSYILKPIDIQQLEKTIKALWEYWFGIVVLPSRSNL